MTPKELEQSILCSVVSEHSRFPRVRGTGTRPDFGRVGEVHWPEGVLSLPAREVNQLQVLLLSLAGGINRNEPQVMEYLQEEVRSSKNSWASNSGSATTSAAAWGFSFRLLMVFLISGSTTAA